MTRPFALALLACLLVAPDAGATRSSRGRDFWAIDTENVGDAGLGSFGIQVTNEGARAATVRVDGNGGELARATVAPGGAFLFAFPRTRMMAGTSRSPNAYHVVSDEPIRAYQLNPLEATFSNDISLLLPTEALGTRYRAFAAAQIDLGRGLFGRGFVAIASTTREPVQVTVTPTVDVLGGFVGPTPGGTPITFTLAPFEVAQLVSADNGDDMSGTLVETDRPVAVVSGSLCARIPDSIDYCDHVEEMLFSIDTWGPKIVAVKTAPRGTGADLEPDMVRIVASQADTTVDPTPNPFGAPLLLQRGQWLDVPTYTEMKVVADKPIAVGQYFVGRGWNPAFTTGDPSLVLALQASQMESEYLVVTPDGYVENFVTLLAGEGSTVSIDGNVVLPGVFRPVGSGFIAGDVALLPGLHHIRSDMALSACMHGRGPDVSYAFNAGALANNLDTTLSCDAGGPYVAGCDGAVVHLDATRSSGAPVTALWSTLTPGVTIADPSALETDATVTGTGPWMLALTLTSADSATTCTVSIDSSPGGNTAPWVDCPARIDATTTRIDGGWVDVRAVAGDACSAPPAVTNDRTAGGADASDDYPCGETLVTFTATDAEGLSSQCETLVVVTDATPPGEVSDVRGGETPLRVAKIFQNTAEIRVSFEDVAIANVYRGPITPAGILPAGHVPLICRTTPVPSSPGRAEWLVPYESGDSVYYLVTASGCASESTKGFRSDGVERPLLPIDCGPAR